MGRRILLLTAWLLVGAETAIAVIGSLSSFQSDGTAVEVFFGESVFVLAGILFASVGAVIVTRQPRNLIGWLMMAPGFLTFGALATIPPPPNPGLFEYVGIYFSSVSWILIVFPVALLIALFPTGSPVGPRWRWHSRLAVGMPAFFLLYVAFSAVWADTEATPPWSITNPIGFLTADPFANQVFSATWTAALAAVVGGATVAMVVRYRRAHYVERQQIKWLLYAVAIFAVSFIAQAVVANPSGNETLLRLIGVAFPLGLMFIPVAIAIALLKYKVFDIDLVIRRTLSYTVVTIVLVTVYLGSVVATQALLEQTLGFDSTVGIAVSTLIVAALFNPLRGRVQHVVDRRFNRSQYDLDSVQTAFVDRLNDAVHINEIKADLLGVVSQTMHPTAVGIWVSERAVAGREKQN